MYWKTINGRPSTSGPCGPAVTAYGSMLNGARCSADVVNDGDRAEALGNALEVLLIAEAELVRERRATADQAALRPPVEGGPSVLVGPEGDEAPHEASGPLARRR